MPDAPTQKRRRVVDLSHVIREGLVTLPGLPAPVITPHLTREDSVHHYADGIDAINIDLMVPHGERPAHTRFLAEGIHVVEHLTNLGALPESGALFTAAPPAFAGFGTFPVRAYATLG